MRLLLLLLLWLNLWKSSLCCKAFGIKAFRWLSLMLCNIIRGYFRRYMDGFVCVYASEWVQVLLSLRWELHYIVLYYIQDMSLSSSQQGKSVATLAADTSRHLLVCFLWVMKNADKNLIQRWTVDMPPSQLNKLLELLTICLSCFEYRVSLLMYGLVLYCSAWWSSHYFMLM